MSANAAGSALNAQNAVHMLRQTIQAEQVAAAAMTEAAKQAVQAAPQPARSVEAAPPSGVGENVDVKV